MTTKPTFQGFILIGGQSSRMGTDKFALQLNGRTFLEIGAETLSAARLERVSVVVSDSSTLVADLPTVSDIFRGRGALSGIHAALDDSNAAWTVILACDYPLVSAELITYLIELAEKSDDWEAVIPIQKDGRVQSLCAVYKTDKSRDVLTELLRNSGKNLSVRDFLNCLNVRYVPFSDLAGISNIENCFINVNTREEFDFARAAVGDQN